MRNLGLDSKSGQLLWIHQLVNSILDQTGIVGKGYQLRPFIAMAYANGDLYVRARSFSSEVQRAQLEGHILALDAQTGGLKWRFVFYFFPLVEDEPDAVATPLLVGCHRPHCLSVAWPD